MIIKFGSKSRFKQFDPSFGGGAGGDGGGDIFTNTGDSTATWQKIVGAKMRRTQSESDQLIHT